MLKIQDLTVRYRREGQPVLHHLALNVAAGECLALVGPSGSGKTTLLRSVNASVGIESGQVWVGDVEVSSAHGVALRAIRSRIAFIAQKHDLVDRLKTYQNVMAGALGRWSTTHALRFLVWPQASELEEAREALQSVGLAQKLRSHTTELSGGEQQRVAIARALVQHPLVILADEPIASLDPDTAAQVLELLCNLARNRGITLICSLHQPDLAHRYFDRILRIHGGQAVQVPTASARARRAAAVPC
jgi:phosphonate transport system ATP-binding protein